MKKKLPFKAYLVQCECCVDNEIGFLYKKPQKVTCSSERVTEVLVSKVNKTPPKKG